MARQHWAVLAAKVGRCAMAVVGRTRIAQQARVVGLAALCVVAGAACAPLAYRLAWTLHDEATGRVAGLLSRTLRP